MALIKNVKDLNREELENFEKLYIEYFRKACVRSNAKHPQISKINDWMMARKYVLLMMEDIKKGYKTAFAAFDFQPQKDTLHAVIRGLIVGYETDAGMANISHLYVQPYIEFYPRALLLRELYKKFAEDVKSHGMMKIQTSSDLLSPTLTDDLENLNFDLVGMNGTEMHYAKSL